MSTFALVILIYIPIDLPIICIFAISYRTRELTNPSQHDPIIDMIRDPLVDMIYYEIFNLE